FNVSEKGAVINNAKNIARSRIAGLINGNNNIKDTRAKLALLDVTGLEETKLKGILEALSKDKLDVILSLIMIKDVVYEFNGGQNVK
ncbi:hypothetical protein, partial [Streptobacillus felis]